MHGPQCPCCMGTDVAHEIGQPCYAEEMQRRHDKERRFEDEAYAAYADHAEAAEAIIAFASAALRARSEMEGEG